MCLPSPKLTSMSIIPTTPEEILDIGRTCKGTRSKVVDDIDPHLAGMHLHRIATPLSIIINLSLLLELLKKIRPNDWFLANKLSLNLDKTNYILFKSHRKPAPTENRVGLFKFKILLSQVESTRLLGFHVDQHLTWTTHKQNFFENCQEYWSCTSYCPSVASVY